MRLPRADIDAFVSDKSQWIHSKIIEQTQKKSEAPQVIHEQELLFFGRPRRLLIYPGPKRIVEKDDHLLIQTHRPDSAAKQLQQWLKSEAELYITARVDELAEELGQQHRIKDIRFRKTRSKWGHCTSEGRLQFNWLIIMAPAEVIDYLIIHELCHLTHMNHSSAFWQLVGRYCNSYETHRQWLKDNGHKIWLETA
ncbi:Uncharacterised protein [BD1-7 clade bacterium]|uniref:YgjP-like metallopeptidase domain-containing protein n=1 Tax=BD1-7 clade bacterium TaxID=2029982 RepID=A0A5S9QIQ6_9GAMM|nr:Uncharacterised protein [BD1-7 clade bacterium]CAA0117458.1 Uncharacterised protein [BD1-7 clade bacterium]